MRAHGVLWVVDQLMQGNVCDDALLASALNTWRFDTSVFLPADEILARLNLLLPQGELSRTSDSGPGEVRDEPGGAPHFG